MSGLQHITGGWLSGASRRAVRAVDGVSLEVRRGETLAIVGESGCGKSTLGRVVAGIHGATEGQVLFHGRDVAGLTGDERHSRNTAHSNAGF